MSLLAQKYFLKLPTLASLAEDLHRVLLDSEALQRRLWKTYHQMEVLHLETSELKGIDMSRLRFCLPDGVIRLISIFRVRGGQELFPHRDYRSFALNIPLSGDFEHSPISWYEPKSGHSSAFGEIKDGPAQMIQFLRPEECCAVFSTQMDTPILINTSLLHGVSNRASGMDRLVLSVSGKEGISFEDALRHHI